jgi:hypothetical protein
MTRPRILVINPNSNGIVTRGLEVALKPLDFADGPDIVCATLAEGPYGESRRCRQRCDAAAPAGRERLWRCGLRDRLL